MATETILFNKMNSRELKISTLLVLFLRRNDLTRLFQFSTDNLLVCYFRRCTLGMCALRRRVICGGLIQPVHNCPFGIFAQAKQMTFEGYSSGFTDLVAGKIGFGI